MTTETTQSIAVIDHTGVKSGMDKYTSAFANAFATFGYTVDVFSNFKSTHSRAVTYHEFFESKKSPGIKRLIMRLVGYFKSALLARKTDIVFVHLFELTPVTFLQHVIIYCFNRKVVTIYHDISAFSKNDSMIVARLILSKMSVKIIVHNDFSRRYLLELYPFVTPEKVIIMKHGHFITSIDVAKNHIDVSHLVDISVLKQQGKKVLLFFGQIKREKGLIILLEAIKKSSEEIMLIVAGKAAIDFREYQKYIIENNLGRRVYVYSRFIQDDEMYYLFQNADLIVIPYLKIFQSGVLLNAISQKSLVLASNLEANADIIKDGYNGFLFDTGSSTSLKNKISSIFSLRPGVLNQIKENGYNTLVSDYNWNDILRDLIRKLA
jgi:D-inositol-3-phosphate glycosyltransferase